MRNAAHEGALALLPVFFASPSDPRLRAEDRAFLFGPDLLIVPHWPEGTIDDASSLELPNGFDHEITLVGEQPDVDVALNFGSSGQLAAQISDGATADVAAFADTFWLVAALSR